MSPGASDGGPQFSEDHGRVGIEKVTVHRSWKRGHVGKPRQGAGERAAGPKAFIRARG